MTLRQEFDEDIVWGTPMFAETDVPVESLLTYLNEGLSVEDFLKDYPGVTHEEAISKLKAIRGD